MKKIILLALITLICFSQAQAQAQERANRSKLAYHMSSDILNEAKGYSYNDNYGEWIEFDNMFSAHKELKKHKILGRAYIMSLSEQNFEKIQTKIITIDNTKYYVLLIEYHQGAYRYPSIQRDWQHVICIACYVFMESEYQKLHDLHSNISLETNYKVLIIGGGFNKKNFSQSTDLIQTALNKKTIGESFKFQIWPADNDKVRFYLPFNTAEFEPDSTKKYFEVDRDVFEKIIIHN